MANEQPKTPTAPKINETPKQPKEETKPGESPDKGPLADWEKERDERRAHEARMDEARSHLKPGQVLTKEQTEGLEKKREGKQAEPLVTDRAGNVLEENSRVLVEARVTKAEKGKVDLEIADPDPEGKPIKVSGVPASILAPTGYNPRVGANPLKRGPLHGIREVPVKGGGVRPAPFDAEDDKSTEGLTPETVQRISSMEPEEKKKETKKAA